MGITRRIEGDVAILSLSGRLDMSSAKELKSAARDIIRKGNCKLILNMERVDFINSSGLGTLVSILKDVRNSNGRMKLTNLVPHVRELFDMTLLSTIFDICDDERTARNAFLLDVARSEDRARSRI